MPVILTSTDVCDKGGLRRRWEPTLGSGLWPSFSMFSPGVAVMALSKPCFDKGTIAYIETKRRSPLFFLGFFLFFAGAALLVLVLAYAAR